MKSKTIDSASAAILASLAMNPMGGEYLLEYISEEFRPVGASLISGNTNELNDYELSLYLEMVEWAKKSR